MSLAILCPGQGGQHVGMFARIAQLPAASDVIAAAANVLGTDPIALAADPRRFDNAIAQPLVCAGTLAHWQALRAQLPTPTLVLGYSVGELAAHAVAGSIDIPTCLHLAATRAHVMDAASPADAGLMAVVGLSIPAVDALCQSHGAVVAIINGDDHAVLGGPRSALAALGNDASARGARVTLAGQRARAYALAATGSRCIRRGAAGQRRACANAPRAGRDRCACRHHATGGGEQPVCADRAHCALA